MSPNCPLTTRFKNSRTAVHLAWLLVLLLVQTGGVLASGGGANSGP